MGNTELVKVRAKSITRRAEMVDVSAILKKEEGNFTDKDLYDFGLEKTLDQRVLLKKFRSAIAKG